MSTDQTIAAINAEIQREELAAIEKAEGTADDQDLLFSVLSCPHTITHESITLRFNPKQEGYNALAQLHHRLAAADAAPWTARASCDGFPAPTKKSPNAPPARKRKKRWFF